MIEERITSYPDLSQDTLSRVAQCRSTLISMYRELSSDCDTEIESGALLPVNTFNRLLFDLIKLMIGEEKEHASVVQSFLNCNRLMLDKIAEMSFCDFNHICCAQFVGFRSNMSVEDVLDALDGNIRDAGNDVCQDYKSRFIMQYWMEIWRHVRSNYLHTKICTQLDGVILNKLCMASVDQVSRFVHDSRQSFVLSFDIDSVLKYEQAQLARANWLPMHVPPLIKITRKSQSNPESETNSKKTKKKKKKIPSVFVTVDKERKRAEDEFLAKEAVLQNMLMFFNFQRISTPDPDVA